MAVDETGEGPVFLPAVSLQCGAAVIKMDELVCRCDWAAADC